MKRLEIKALLHFICLLASLDAAANPVLGQWGPLTRMPHRSVHSHLLPTGEVLLWFKPTPANPGTSRLDTDTGVFTPVLFPYNIFCSGHSFLSDGRLFTTGGTMAGTQDHGIPNTSIFDPESDSWTAAANMNGGRWYPTNVALGDGKVVVLSGTLEDGLTRNLIPQVYDPADDIWRTLNTASLRLPLYPAAFLAPNGRVFVADNTSRYLDLIPPGGAWSVVADTVVRDHSNYGSAAQYDRGRIIYTGGGPKGVDPIASAEVIDLTAATPAWSLVAPMPQPRRNHNITILPTGNLLVTGGTSRGFNTADGPKPAIMWDPALNTWSSLATEASYRGYHSTAVLLPDGRVISMGVNATYQIFSPPYLFQGAQPVITSAPSQVTYGETFSVSTPDSASITAVNWIRLGSVTHTKNMNQRINKLSFTNDVPGELAVVAPAGANECPPGHYMLFVIKSGVPSKAAIMHIA